MLGCDLGLAKGGPAAAAEIMNLAKGGATHTRRRGCPKEWAMPSKSKAIFPPYKRASVDSLVPYARNSRTHSEAQVAQIAASIREFGFTNPVLVDAGGGVIAGHGRLLAARMLGLAEVPVIELGHLTEAQRRAYVIADNKLALNAGWDFDALENEIRDLDESHFDVLLTGFDEGEIAAMMLADSFKPTSEGEQTRLDEKKPIECPACGEEIRV